MKAAIIESYYSNEGKRLRKLVDSILVRFGGIYDKDKDDFYSIGNEVFVSAIRSYVDGKQSFDSYLRGCISNRVKTEITRRNAAKRSADIIPMSGTGKVNITSLIIGVMPRSFSRSKRRCLAQIVQS